MGNVEITVLVNIQQAIFFDYKVKTDFLYSLKQEGKQLLLSWDVFSEVFLGGFFILFDANLGSKSSILLASHHHLVPTTFFASFLLVSKDYLITYYGDTFKKSSVLVSLFVQEIISELCCIK